MHHPTMVTGVLRPLTWTIVAASAWGCDGPNADPQDSGPVGDPSAQLATGDAWSGLTTRTAENQCDQFDDDRDGLVDEGCPCASGQTQDCYPRAKGSVSTKQGKLQGLCSMGTQTCPSSDEEFADPTWGACKGYVLPAEEICGDGKDQDCDGSDLPCTEKPTPPPGPKQVHFEFKGDCVIAECPAEAPYVVGCDVTYGGGDGRACVAQHPNDSKVYFQEGNDRCFGSVSGTLTCSATPGPPLDQDNCVIRTTKPGGFTGVTYHQGGCGGCVKTKCNLDPFTCPYR